MLARYVSGISPDFLSHNLQLIMQFLLGIGILWMFGKEVWRTGPTFWRIVTIGILILEHVIALTNPDYELAWTIALDNGFVTALFFRWFSGIHGQMRMSAVVFYGIHVVIWVLGILFVYLLSGWSMADNPFMGIFLAMVSTMCMERWQKFRAELKQVRA